MMIDVPQDARILIFEGVPGSGKTTLIDTLKKQIKGRAVYVYKEQELMLGWKHIHMPKVSSLRIDYSNLFLDELERKLEKDQNSLFILERFHLSMKVLEWEFEHDFAARYQTIVERLRALPVHIFLLELNRKEIRERMHHRERSWQWEEFIEEKLALRGFDDLELLSIEQQRAFLDAASKQGLPYSVIHVDLSRFPSRAPEK